MIFFTILRGSKKLKMISISEKNFLSKKGERERGEKG